MASSDNGHALGNVDDARVLRRERDRARAAAMTDEQREEKNRKRRESYKKRKCDANNKENVPVGNNNASDTSIISKLAEDHTGERILSDLTSDDKRIERNKKRRESYCMNKDKTQIKSNSAAEHHEYVAGTPTTIEDPTGYVCPTAEYRNSSIVSTSVVIEHPEGVWLSRLLNGIVVCVAASNFLILFPNLLYPMELTNMEHPQPALLI
ncbi:hypothetical protein C2845_PM07G28250 [Panicum miliaceum]|uniref:Uncharacterized protein n=1 Tax=Panicum miliaceum TaxID=4540 RepID=A0A3L6SS80_PANMI|nr:hypothetical protein C2845_PM07G28250 [Panicum miliaceum]